ncbi:uncharacterized protein BO97DRAFT_405440 [Aspergillus homomorphus CBS 101889]|uniref:DUF6924 domain-containing protein n=1 Tax=Aspergillus homomorphus (strain CBS 101889) TaxID=1450537 RepID=A0A395I1Q8_ASPHC|nr:hypothetical protein BO97DRAFT_405440 [Aspergillus homomorphus CBS 101889]RAL12494.1 hypothetical protein BO97DRAFT_405440 [Aspergillus homomorphus CBS 101889]
MSLIPIICTHEVSSTVIASILSKAYETARKIDSPASLLLLTTTSAADLQQYTEGSATKPPVASSPYPFLCWDIGKIARFLCENASMTVVDHSVFLVADEKTAFDEDTLLLVHSVENSQVSIRLSAGYANSQAVSVSVATTDVGELRSLADEDGVYRGGPERPPPIRGGKAPRKQL